MPPARRGRPPGSTSSAPSNGNPRAAQQTLAFGRKNNKITKPSLPPPSSRKISKVKDDGEPTTPTAAAEVASVEDVKVEDGKVEVVDEDPALAYGRERGMAIREAKQDEQTSKQDPMEEKAKAVSEAAVKRYWREREAERKAPRGKCQNISFSSSFLIYRVITFPHLQSCFFVFFFFFGRGWGNEEESEMANLKGALEQSTKKNSPCMKRSCATSTSRHNTDLVLAFHG